MCWRILKFVSSERRTAPQLTENYVSSNEKIKRAIGVGRLPVDARDGIVKTIESFRK